jgi:hypothetical protein
MFLLFDLFGHHPAREIIMLDHRLLCVPAILMLLVIPAAAQENVKPYSPQEIDSMLGSLRNNVTTEVDTKLNLVNSSLAT